MFMVCMLAILYRVVNEPLESISLDLGFSGNTLAEGDIFFSQAVFVLLTFASRVQTFNMICYN